MHLLLGALAGAILSAAITAILAAAQRRRPTLPELLLAAGAGALGGAITAATLGLGGAAAVSTARQVASFSAGGAAASAAERTGRNALEGRPLAEGTASAAALGAAGGVVAPAAGKVVTAVAARVQPATRGIVRALGGESDGARPLPAPAAPARPAPRAGLAAVHPPAPAWLEARIAATVDAVRRGAGPAAEPKDVEAFLRETYEHVLEVNALVKALGGRPRPLPATAGGDDVLRGVHDLGERASVRRVEELIARLRREPLTDRDGVPLEVPAWLARLPVDARRAGESTIDVGKLSPYVAAGLSRRGPPDPFAIRLHNLAPHHAKLNAAADGVPRAALIEEVADKVNAMRQVRVYRPEPMPFARIEAILLDDVAAGRLPPEARDLVRRALDAQRDLELRGVVTPYHLAEPAVVR